MMRAPIFSSLLLLGALILAGCAGQSPESARGVNAYAVVFSVTRNADHARLAAVSLPVNLGGQARVKIAAQAPGENQPVVREFLARLNRPRPNGTYELVTRVSVREAIRNKKGKLKVSKRFIGALVPTRVGETQVVNLEGDPIHVEARLERR